MKSLFVEKRLRYGDSSITISDFEKSYITRFPSITTITYYKEFSTNYITDRAVKIIKKNPWLASRLIKVRNELQLQYFKNPINPESYVTSASSIMNSSDIPVQTPEFWNNILTVHRGDAAINKLDAQLFQVVAINLADGCKALLISMNHTLGDGHTYYSIYKMFDPSCPIVALNPERVFKNLKQKFQEVLGPSRCQKSPCYTLRYVYNYIFTRPDGYQMFKVSKPSIEKAKESLSQRESCEIVGSETIKIFQPYISTNDILTSCIFKATNVDIGLMAVNFRERIKDVTSFHAGNYLNLIGHTRQDFRTPGCIRGTLTNMNGKFERSTRYPFPSIWKSFGNSCRTGNVTNWASFYHCLVIEGNPPIGHYPIRIMQNDSMRFVKGLTGFDSTSIIFKFAENDIRVLGYGFDKALLSESGLLTIID